MLRAGSLTATVTSRRSGDHITLRLRATRRAEGQARTWPTVPFEEATHVFIDAYDGERVATYYPQKGKLWMEAGMTRPVQWTVVALLKFLAGMFPLLAEQADLAEADLCGRCGRELTNPESLARGLGDDCAKAVADGE
jgi:hypothetical protein